MPLPLLFSREERAAHWEKAAQEAPYRASINGNAEWEFSRPLPDDVADALRVTHGGRLLLAFRYAEVRDYFVEGHLDQGAHAEPDDAEKPRRSAAAKREASPVSPTLEEAVAAVRTTARAENAAYDAVNRVFLTEVRSLLAEGRFKSALSIVKSIPPDCVARTIGIDNALKAGLDTAAMPLDKVEKAPLTAERGRALLDWLRATKANRAAESALTAIIEKPLLAMIEAKDLDGAEALVQKISPSMTAVHADNCLWDLRQKRKAALAAQAVESEDPDEPTGGFRLG